MCLLWEGREDAEVIQEMQAVGCCCVLLITAISSCLPSVGVWIDPLHAIIAQESAKVSVLDSLIV